MYCHDYVSIIRLWKVRSWETCYSTKKDICLASTFTCILTFPTMEMQIHFHVGPCIFPQATVNSLTFARDLFDDFRDHIKIVKINTCKHNSGS